MVSPPVQTFNRDDCFDGSHLPGVNTIPSDEWRWYILERRLSAGTERNFTTTIGTCLSSHQL